MREITNSDDIIDSRDVIERIRELTDLADGDEDEETERERTLLLELEQEGEGVTSDWQHGATLIRDSYFEDHARQEAEDLDLIGLDASWPNNHINWEEAADELREDYTPIEFDGVTYWVR